MNSLRRYLPVILVCIAGSLLSVESFSIIGTIESNRAQAHFNRAAADRIFAVGRSIHESIDAVASLAAFIVAHGDADRDAFDAFASSTIERQKGIKALEWIPRIAASERTTYEALAHQDGFPAFRITEREAQGKMVPAGDRDEYFPVYFVTPYAGNEIALGFDLGSNATRLAALEAARDNGKSVVSGRITLVQESGSQYGFLAFTPVYRTRLPDDTVEQRRKNLRGFTLGVFRMGDVVEGAFYHSATKALKHPAGIDLYLYDLGGEADARLLHVYSSRSRTESAPLMDENEARVGPHTAQIIDVAGRQWLIVARPKDEGFSTGSAWQAWTAALMVLAFTAMLAAYLVSGVNRTKAIEALVNERTLELQQLNETLVESQARASAVVENIVDGIVTIDGSGVIQSFNPAAETIFGYTADEAIHRNVNILMPEPFHGSHDEYLTQYAETGEGKIIGVGREVVGQRKDGSTFPLDLAVSESWLGDRPLFTGIARDITDRKEVDRMKNEFISTVSHELRTPLTSIMGSLGLVRSGSLGEYPKKIGSLIDIAHNNSERLVRLINDLLHMEKVEFGNFDEQVEPLDMVSLVDAAIADNKGYCEQFGVTCELQGRRERIVVPGSRDRLIQVLTNLISNAAKFSRRGGHVEITISRRDDRVRVDVVDHGSGIAPDFQDCVFQQFAQADSSDHRRIGGTGLGLSICKAIVEGYGGTIGFDTTQGNGTTFHFDLPIWVREVDHTTPGRQDQSRVLVCEDDADIARLLAMKITQGGFQTDIAGRAAAARELLTDHDYVAMTLDLVLPDQDGIALIHELRRSPDTVALPLIVVSAEANRGAKELNGDAFLVIDWMEKPIDQARLKDNLRRVMDGLAPGKTRILHVEDDGDIVKIVTMIIGDDAAVTVVRDLNEARLLLAHQTFDLAILDLILTDGSGEALLPLFNPPGRPAVPVIIFSVNEVSRRLAESVSAALVKANTPNEVLAATIRSHISRQSLTARA